MCVYVCAFFAARRADRRRHAKVDDHVRNVHQWEAVVRREVGDARVAKGAAVAAQRDSLVGVYVIFVVEGAELGAAAREGVVVVVVVVVSLAYFRLIAHLVARVLQLQLVVERAPQLWCFEFRAWVDHYFQLFPLDAALDAVLLLLNKSSRASPGRFLGESETHRWLRCKLAFSSNTTNIQGRTKDTINFHSPRFRTSRLH